MSRFSDYDDYEGEPDQVLAMGRWQRNARATLKSKRGRKALADLREALMALPEHRLIEGAVCTVGADSRKTAMVWKAHAQAQKARDLHAQWAAEWRAEGKEAAALRIEGGPDPLVGELENAREAAEELDHHISRDGEGVCAVGAYAWHQRVKGGMSPAEAFASLPDVAEEGEDGLIETAHLGESAGLAYTLAWELAFRNDEIYGRETPEERWTAFVAWIDQELAAA